MCRVDVTKVVCVHQPVEDLQVLRVQHNPHKALSKSYKRIRAPVAYLEFLERDVHRYARVQHQVVQTAEDADGLLDENPDSYTSF